MLSHIRERKFKYLSIIKEFTFGYKTGFPTLDNMISGIKPRYHLIAARPSMGKSSLAMNMAVNIGLSGKKILFFSLEMSELMFIERLVSMMLGLSLVEIRNNEIPDDFKTDYANIDNYISKLDMFVDYTSLQTPATIAQRLDELYDCYNFIPDVVFIDYIQYMRTNNMGSPTETANLAEISRGLATLVKQKQIPFIVLAQLNRQASDFQSKNKNQDSAPRLIDLKGSGSLEEDSDIVLMIHREDYYKERETIGYNHMKDSSLHNANIIVAKNRQGQCGSFPLTWLPEIFKFTEVIETKS